jgi:Ca-activated chloride channel family protein
LIGFADLAYSFVPPTLDHGLLLERLNSLELGEVGEQTGIASPIGTAVQRLKNSSAPRRVMVLFTDGANTAQNQLTPRQAAELAKQFNVIIHTVGIGQNEASAIVNTPFGGRLAPVEGSFDAELLHDLAKITGGTAFHAADKKGMQEVMQKINALEKTNITQPRPVHYREWAPAVALIALVLMITGLTAEYPWKMRLP